MSANLRGKSNVWQNSAVSPDDYAKKAGEVDLGSYKNLQSLISEYENLKARSITRFSRQKNTTGSTGNVMANTKNCRHSFYVSEVENGFNLLFVDNAKDTYDVNNGCCVMERMYEINTTGVNCVNVRLSSDTWPEVRDTTYSISCRNSVHDLFGCVGVQKKAYCILNREYSPENYRELVKKIINQMNTMPYVDQAGRTYPFGEFFPPEFSPFAFNESAAYTYTPLSKEDVLARGWIWKEVMEKAYVPTVKADALPDNVSKTTSDILKELFECQHRGNCDEQCTKVFRIIPAELDFYKDKRIALPRLCPNCRHYGRVKQMASLRLYGRQCDCDYVRYENKTRHSHHNTDRCPNTFQTSYAPDRPEIVYCEQCYNSEVV